MATPRSYADPGINERRLRPIYDCLDNNNNKKALQEAEKLLKKQRDLACAKVLKALALIRLGREEEGSNVLKEVHSEGHTEDSTLQAMTICYRELHKPELIADAYEIAVKKEPQNEELFSHLFMAYVRLLDYKKQQQTAMTLYKLKPKNPYYFWAVMSLVMQACDSSTELAEKIHLPLAQKMVEKFINENKIDAEAEIQLYLMILEKQGKYEECLKVLEGPQQEKLSQYMDMLPRKKAELYMVLKRWPEANALYRELLTADPDNWSYYQQYFESLTQLIDSGWTTSDNNRSELSGPDYTYSLACAFINELLEKQAKTTGERKVLRGPFLARIELQHRLSQKEETYQLAQELGSKVSLMVSYFLQYGTRMVCYTDMAHIISSHSWSQDDINNFLEEARKSINFGEDDSQYPQNVKEMQQHLCLCQLQYNLGFYDSMDRENKLKVVETLLRRYSHGQEFGCNLLPTDFHPSDDYALIAALILTDLWEKSGEESILYQVIMLLEQSISSSPSNFHLKLLLIKLYNSIGAVGPSHVVFESMDIKHIQQETMGYLTSFDLFSVGHFSTAFSFFGSTLWFYQGNLKDTVEYLIACYKFGSFIKVQEMVNFRERLNNSSYYASVTLDRIVLSLMLESKNCESPDFCSLFLEFDPKKETFNWKNLQDNKDVSIFRIWSDAKKGVIEGLKKQGFKEEIYWCKLWNIVLQCASAAHRLSISMSHQCNSSPTNNNNNNNHHHNHQNALSNGDESPPQEILLKLTKSFKEHIASIDTKSLQNSIFPLQAPDPLRLKGYLEGGHPAILLSALELILYVHSLTQGAQESNNDRQFKSRIIEGFQAILQRINDLLQCHLTLTQMRNILNESVNFVQTISITSVLFNITRNILKPVKNVSKRNKKRKEHEVALRPEILRQFEEMVSEVSTVIETFVQKLSTLESLFLEICMKRLYLNDKEYCLKDGVEAKTFSEKIEQSYNQSIKEITELAQNKIKFLQGLKL